MAKKKERRKFGDRKDGKLIRDLDPMHVITPVLYPNRCDNEAYISERIDLAPIRAYLEKINAEEETYIMEHNDGQMDFGDVQIVSNNNIYRDDPDQEEVIQAPEPEPEKPKKSNKKIEIDMGKVKALRAAGWTVEKIADDMRVSPATIYRSLKDER